MDFEEHPLLNTPHLSTVILRQAEGGARLEDCAKRLDGLLDRTHEHPGVPQDEVMRHLGLVRRYLAEARLIEPVGDEAFRLTERGREALEAHPRGFDPADLMIYPEFAAFIHAKARARPRMDPRPDTVDRGFSAYNTGSVLSDNPYPPDSADHLAWENGWFDGFDEEFRTD